jgi:hypothetical protein
MCVVVSSVVFLSVETFMFFFHNKLEILALPISKQEMPEMVNFLLSQRHTFTIIKQQKYSGRTEKFVSDLQQVAGFLQIPCFHWPITLTIRK